MRTTLTLDDDLARELHETARHSSRSFKEVVNLTLRRGLSVGEAPTQNLPRFVVRPKACGFRPGIDIHKLNQLADELAIEDFTEKLGKGLDPP